MTFIQPTTLSSSTPLSRERVAILGCGYVGQALASHWQQQGDAVTATTTRAERSADLQKVASQVVIMKGNNLEAVQSLIQDQDIVVVSIAPISDRQVAAEVYRDTYIPTVKNLVTALKQTTKAPHLIYLNSCSVYGDQQGRWVDETSPVDPSNDYNQVLSEAEQRLLDSGHQFSRICSLRLGGIYGPGRELTKRFQRIAGQTMPGSGQTFTNWIHLDDIVAAIDFLRQQKLEGIYNLVNDFNLTIRELSNLICELQGLPNVIWDDTQPSYRTLNARIRNQKIKDAGYQLIHPQTII
jgi:nucleoside-diphosphate-sugar epimerase